jgi:uracil-DNA glycosylase
MPSVRLDVAQRSTSLRIHQAALRECRRCSNMHAPPIVGEPVLSSMLLVGQAPGDREPRLGRPFAWTAGKQLFKWFAPLGLSESEFRARVYMAAVCRCFPGKRRRGGDRVPAQDEIDRCRPWLEREIELLRPRLIVPVGRLAIEQFLPARPLTEQIGRVHSIVRARRTLDVIPLPHPSGASPWPRIEPGKTLTLAALRLIGEHAGFPTSRLPQSR